MRSDAVKHREELVASAARIFTKAGLGVPLQAVLDETKLGRGTLYRHFPDREALIVAVIEYVYEQISGIVTQWQGSPDMLRRYLRVGAEVRAPLINLPDNVDALRLRGMTEEVRAKFEALQQRAIDAAIASGEVPPGFDNDALELVMRMLGAAADVAETSRSQAVERALDIIFAGLHETEREMAIP